MLPNMVPSRSRPVFSSGNLIFLISPSKQHVSFPVSLYSSSSSGASLFRSLFVARLSHPSSYRPYSVQTTGPLSPQPPHPPFPSPPSFKKPSILRRLLGFTAIAVFSFTVGISLSPGVSNMVQIATQIRTDDESIYIAPDDILRDIDAFIHNHPLAHSLRTDERFTESRPHLKIPAELRAHNLTAGTLAGAKKIAVPPYAWTEAGGKSLVSILYLGSDVSGHPGIVHGGLLATILDESLARCCFPALPNGIGVTANLNIDYRSPAPAGSFFVVRAETVKVEGRKAWVEGRIETLPDEGREPVVVAEAKALFIEPKNAASLPRLYKAT
ncbi:thioesterase [Blastomyces gilchristii SLH14081]|uniref:Thioesterase n=1 Tax=Blastomyces gilchristii (strain SLH14081) TaxID=559298 RepID=A0A179U692_BLAGS|nr:thioesterase [Blastomyces gilchristii SLH14081]OAT03524.1 thioesterase [Blastomyces gilchristii SLH14081]